MIGPLPDDLIARIRSRAADPKTRTDAPPSTRGKTIIVGPLSVAGADLGALLRGDADPTPKDGAQSLAAPAGADDIAEAERRLGFAMPVPLKQLYTQIADGGFGQGSGVMPLQAMVEAYLDLLRTPPGR